MSYIYVPILPKKITPQNPTKSIFNNKLDAEGKIGTLDALNLALNEIIILQESGVGGTGITLENITNTGGAGILKEIVGGVGKLKTIAATNSNFITVTDDAANGLIKIDVSKANMGIDKVQNYSLQEMVDTVGSPIKIALATKPTLTGGRIDATVLPLTVPIKVNGKLVSTDLPDTLVYTTAGKIPIGILPDSVTLPSIVEFSGLGNRPASGAANTIYVDTAVTPNKQYRWSGTAWVEVGGGSGGITGVTINNITGTTFSFGKADVGLGSVENYSLSAMVTTEGSAIKTALDLKANDSALANYLKTTDAPNTVKGYFSATGVINATTGETDLLSYSSSTGKYASGFTNLMKNKYEAAYDAKHTHSNATLLESITSQKIAVWDTNSGAAAVDPTPRIIIVTGATTTWVHNPLRPNVVLYLRFSTLLVPTGLTIGSYGTVEIIQDKTGGRVVTFAGIAPSNYPATVATVVRTQPWDKYIFYFLRDTMDLTWDSTYKNVGDYLGSNVTPGTLQLDTPKVTMIEDLGAGQGVRLSASAVPKIESVDYQRSDWNSSTNTWSTYGFVRADGSGNVNYESLQYLNSVLVGSIPAPVTGGKYRYQARASSNAQYATVGGTPVPDRNILDSDWVYMGEITKL